MEGILLLAEDLLVHRHQGVTAWQRAGLRPLLSLTFPRESTAQLARRALRGKGRMSRAVAGRAGKKAQRNGMKQAARPVSRSHVCMLADRRQGAPASLIARVNPPLVATAPHGMMAPLVR